MKNKIKIWLLKTYYSIVGFFLIMKIKNDKKLYFTQNNGNVITTYKYIGNNNFIINTQGMEPTTGVVMFKEYKTFIKYWVIGSLFKNKIIKMYQHND